MLVIYRNVDISSFVFQSKEIGLQMHEELLKVTNELYTVSSTAACGHPSPARSVEGEQWRSGLGVLCWSDSGLLFQGG